MAIVLALLLAFAVLALLWIGIRGALAANHLLDARDGAAKLQQVAIDDPAAAKDLVTDVAKDTAEARKLTSDPLWRAAETLPWVGPQLSAVSTLSGSLDDLVAGAAQPLIEILPELQPDKLMPESGRIDLAPLVESRAIIASANEAAQSAVNRAGTIDTMMLIGALREPAAQGVAQLSQVADLVDVVDNATALLPPVLGSEGSRDYLLVFQNNAEWRSLGGIAGTMALLHTENGSIELTEFRTSADFPNTDKPVIELDPELEQIYETRVARYAQNATQVPDFEVAAEIAQQFWKRAGGGDVDGVLSLDPVALSYLLNATGPVDLPTGETLTADNAVKLLLNEVYFTLEDPKAQDAFFGEAADAIFGALSGGDVDPAALLQGLARAGEEHRLLLWSTRAAEQSILEGTTLEGALPETGREATRFGVYLNDGSASKLDYYMTAATGTSWCTSPNGTSSAVLRVELGNDMPADVTTLPQHLLGGDPFGERRASTDTPLDVVRTVAYVYLPGGTSARLQDADRGELSVVGEHDGHQVLAWWTDLRPGDTASLDVVVDTQRTVQLEAVATPTVATGDATQAEATCEPAS